MMKKFVVVLAACVAGCVPPGLQSPVVAQMYEGPSLPLDQVAVIAPATPSAQATIIDGTPYWDVMIRKNGPYGPSRSKGIHVLPGRHVVQVALQPRARIGGSTVTFTHASVDLEVELKAGHTYVPRAGKPLDGKVPLWLEDMGVGFDQECLVPRQSCLD